MFILLLGQIAIFLLKNTEYVGLPVYVQRGP